MKKAIKRSLSILLAITIIFSSAYVGLGESDFSEIFTVKVKAASSGTCGENLTWKLDDEGTLTISGTGDMTNYSFGFLVVLVRGSQIYYFCMTLYLSEVAKIECKIL